MLSSQGRSWLGVRVTGVGYVNVLASNNSTPKVGTTVHTIAHTNVTSNLGIGNVCEKCRNLVGGRVVSFAARGIDGVVRQNKAVLGATHDGRFMAPRNHGITCSGVGTRKVSTLIIVNNGNSLTNTDVFTRRFSVPYVNLPKAVSGSLGKASSAVNCSAALGAVIRYISGVHSATASRRHVFFVRIVKHSTNFLTRGDTVTDKTRTTVVPRSSAGTSRLRRFVDHNVHGDGDSDVIVISRDPGYNTVCCTSQIGGRCPRFSIHISVLNRLRQNNSPDTCSHVLTSHLNINTVATLHRKRHGIVVNVEGSRIICIPFYGTVGDSGSLGGRLVDMLKVLSVWCVGMHTHRSAIRLSSSNNSAFFLPILLGTIGAGVNHFATARVP